VEDIKTIFDLKLLERAAEFCKKLRGMDYEFVFSIARLLNKNKGACVEQDQQ